MSTPKQSIQMKAVILTGNMKTTNKSNGAVSELHRAEILDGPLAGKVVLCNRTVLNKDKQVKKACSEQQEVTLFMTQLSAEESTTGKRALFFEVSTGQSTDAVEDLFAVLDAQAVSGQKIG